jgi:predicted PurR-regulated permease PerM
MTAGFWDARAIAVGDAVKGHTGIPTTDDGLHWNPTPPATTPTAPEAGQLRERTACELEGPRVSSPPTVSAPRDTVGDYNPQGIDHLAEPRTGAGMIDRVPRWPARMALAGHDGESGDENVAVTSDGGFTWMLRGRLPMKTGAWAASMCRAKKPTVVAVRARRLGGPPTTAPPGRHRHTELLECRLCLAPPVGRSALRKITRLRRLLRTLNARITRALAVLPRRTGVESPPRGRRGSHVIVGLFFLALMYTVHVGRALAVALLFAVFINYLFSPAVRWLARRGVPRSLSAFALLAGLTVVVAGTTAALAVPAASWVAKAPAAMQKAQAGIAALKARVRKASAVATTLERVTALEEPKNEVVISQKSLGSRVFGSTTSLLGAAFTVLLLSFLLLAPGDKFMEKLVGVLPTRQDKVIALRVSREIETQVSRYILTVTLVNVALGAVTAIVLWGLGMPNPVLWGVLAGVLNYIPYVGSIITMAVLALVSLMTFDSIGRALVPPAMFFVLNMIESNIVTPKVLERWLELNAVIGFVGVLFFWLCSARSARCSPCPFSSSSRSCATTSTR